jgi:hypothetical protein
MSNLFRCSALHRIMKGGVVKQGLTDKQSQDLKELTEKIKITDKQAETRDKLIAKRDAPPTLSTGAINEIRSIVKSDYFGYREIIDVREMEKGIRLEDEAIAFSYPNSVKNTIRLRNSYIQGEADIVLEDEIVDIKIPFTLKSMPQDEGEAIKDEYIWQLRGYMWLYEKPRATICYVGMDTPSSLIRQNEDKMMHQFNHLPKGLRITKFSIERDLEIEKQMVEQIKLAQVEYKSYFQFLINKCDLICQ